MTDNALNIDMLWMLICAAFVMLMQGGFTCLETGLVRAKNSINVSIKNLVDFCIPKQSLHIHVFISQGCYFRMEFFIYGLRSLDDEDQNEKDDDNR